MDEGYALPVMMRACLLTRRSSCPTSKESVPVVSFKARARDAALRQNGPPKARECLRSCGEPIYVRCTRPKRQVIDCQLEHRRARSVCIILLSQPWPDAHADWSPTGMQGRDMGVGVTGFAVLGLEQGLCNA